MIEMIIIPSSFATMNFATIPLESMLESPSAYVMVVLDDSISMSFSFITPEPEGTFLGYQHMYPLCHVDDQTILPKDMRQYWFAAFSSYNSLYYNPKIIYEPWTLWNSLKPENMPAPNHQADPNTPYCHPMKLGLTCNLDETYLELQGHTVPIAHYFSYHDENQDGQWQYNEPIFLVELNKSAGQGVIDYYLVNHDENFDSLTSGELSQVSMDLYPDITHWPDGQIKTYEKERQNFANWFMFYRTRAFVVQAALGKMIYNLKRAHVGIYSISGRIREEIKVTDMDQMDLNHKMTLLHSLYQMECEGNRPLRKALDSVGQYYDTQKQSSLLGQSPLINDFGTGSCQQLFSLIITDGYYNGASPDVGNIDNNNSLFKDNSLLSDMYANTLADVAMAYYKTDLAIELDNNVPVISAYDYASHQHMVTYAIGLGVSGTLLIDQWQHCPPLCPKWPKPISGQNTTIDDLFHATINGRGVYYQAQTPQMLITSNEACMKDIEDRLCQSSPGITSASDPCAATFIYQASYNPMSWSGDIQAFSLSQSEDESEKPIWSAQSMLQSLNGSSQRQIMTFNGSTGIPFRASYLKGVLDKELIAYIRGDTSLELKNGGHFKDRTYLLGDIIHSSPIYYKGLVFVGANDGMLHAFHAETGIEWFAYIPQLLLPYLYQLADPLVDHQFYIDQTPYISQIQNKSYMICGLGYGGKGYFCLDISNINSNDSVNERLDASNLVKWEYPSSHTQDPNLGVSFSQAFIVNSNYQDTPIAIFGNGYSSTTGKAVLYILDANTGIPIVTTNDGLPGIDTMDQNGDNGLSTPALIDSDLNGTVDYVYAGDLKGNLWKFDLSHSQPKNWQVFYNTQNNRKGSPQPLFQAVNSNGACQPITSRPEIMSFCGKSNAGTMVIFGTGQYLEPSDRQNQTIQSIYGVWDWSDYWDDATTTDINEGITHYLGVFNQVVPTSHPTERRPSNTPNHMSLLKQTSPHQENGEIDTQNKPINLMNALYSPEDIRYVGWYLDLLPGEKIIQSPQVWDQNICLIISWTPDIRKCESGGFSRVYFMSGCTGESQHQELLGLINIGLPIGEPMKGLLSMPVFVHQSNSISVFFNVSRPDQCNLLSWDMPKDDQQKWFEDKIFYWKELF